jgi:hypothetical protein
MDRRTSNVMLGEDGEGPSVFTVCNQQAIVGEQPLDVSGEVREEALGIKRVLHGTTDRRQGGEQINVSQSYVHTASVARSRHAARIFPSPLSRRDEASFFWDPDPNPAGGVS